MVSGASLQTKPRWDLWVVGGLTVLALALRFYRLTAESLWYDEAYSVWSSAMDIASPRILWEWQIEFPLYYWLLHIWMRLFGQGEFAVRAFGALASAASITPMYYLAKRLFGPTTGEIAAFLLAINPYHVWYAQDVRMYPWALLFVTVSLLAFWRVAQGGDWGWRLVYVLATGLTFHLHYYIGWLVLAENVFVLVALWREHGNPFCRAAWLKLRFWLAAQLGVAALAAPAAAVFLTKAVTLNQWDWLAQRYGAPGPRDVIALFLSYTVGTLFPATSSVRWAVLALFGGLAAWGVWWALGRVRRHETPGGALGFTLLALILPLFACFALGQRYSVWVTRYLILFLPLYLILVAQGVVSLAPEGAPPSWQRVASRMLALLLAALVSAYALWAMYTTPQKEDWRGVTAHIAARAAPDDLIVLMDEECRVPWDYYYGSGGRRIGVSRFADDAGLDRALAEIQQQQRGRYLWLVVSHADSADLEQRLATLPNLSPVESPSFIGVKLVVYRWR